MKTIMFVLGTRPEAIKMAMVIKKFQSDKKYKVIIINTEQHADMVMPVLKFFNIKPIENLNIMTFAQTLPTLTAKLIDRLNTSMLIYKPDLVFVQGDTTTAFTGALAAFYNKIPVVHIEAGLRTNNKYAPFPEEVNRKIITSIADYHFTSTDIDTRALLDENISGGIIYKTGNPVIDALKYTLSKCNDKKYYKKYGNIDFSKKTILFTCHRRENIPHLRSILNNILLIAKKHDVNIIWPIHPNPYIHKIINDDILTQPNIYITDPLDYPDMIWIMSKCYLILSDSGGIQEEAPSLKIPVLILRNETERTSAINNNLAKLVGTSTNIYTETSKLLTCKTLYDKMTINTNPFGDGTTSDKIYNYVQKFIK